MFVACKCVIGLFLLMFLLLRMLEVELMFVRLFMWVYCVNCSDDVGVVLLMVMGMMFIFIVFMLILLSLVLINI